MERLDLVIQTVTESFQGIAWQRVYFATKFIFIFLDLILLTAIMLTFPQALKFRPKFNYPMKAGRKKDRHKIPLDKKDMWSAILTKAESAPPHSLTLGVIEADSFVDSILKELGVPGETMADRLKQLSQDIISLNNVWQAHKTRNEIVHSNLELDPDLAKTLLGYYQDFLREIGAI